MPNIPALITLILYSIILFGIGLWAARRAKSQEDFLIGGRNLGPWVAGLAYAASASSAWTMLGFSGFVYLVGPSALWMIPGVTLGKAVVWLGAGHVLQNASRDHNLLTMTDFLTQFASPVSARWIRILASLFISFCFSFYVAAQFQGAGIAINDVFGTAPTTGVLIGALVILIYVFLGGFLAVSLTDTLQGILMAFVAVMLPAFAFFEAGGWAGIHGMLVQAPATYSAPFGESVGFAAFGLAIGLAATGFGAIGQPHLVTWIMATKDRSSRIKGAIVAMGWSALVFSGMAVLGLSGRVIFGAGVEPESIFFGLSNELLPGILGGIVAAGMLSAIMSTVDSQLLVTGGAVSHDLGLGKAMGNREVLATRLAIVGVCIIAVALTLMAPASIFDRVLFAWISLGAAFGPVVMARAFGFQPNGAVVLAGMCTGFVFAIGYGLGWIDSGPGDMWKTTAPWMAAGLIMALVGLALKSRKAGMVKLSASE